ncbi:MAG: hypothetical protein OEN50_10090, partial [Deltaproteobacteria bacterium]|nr:hypothetical protein [Deltaproteobacteria bacterium]
MKEVASDIAPSVFKPISEMPEDVRPYAVAGEISGGSVPIGAAPLMAGGKRLIEREGKKVAPFINKIIDTAQTSPKAFALSESAMAGSAAVGGGIAESEFPGRMGIRVGAEVAGGFLNPTRLLTGALKVGVSGVKKVISSMGRGGREDAGATLLQDLVRQAEEDPAALAHVLEAPDVSGVARTSAQKSGSPALAALEAKLSQQNAKFGAEAKRIADGSMATIKRMIQALEGNGSPLALQEAANIRTNYYKTLLAGQLQEAEKNAIGAAKRITSDTQAARSGISDTAHNLVDNAMREARSAERELWALVPNDIPATPTNIIEVNKTLRKGMLQEEALPAIAEKFIERMGKTNTTTSGELKLIRSRMLALARDAASRNEFNDARIYGNLAEAALDDLGVIGKGVPGYNEAREFSSALHDTFSKTFAGDVLSSAKSGAERIPPEVMMRQAMASGKEVGALRFKELRESMSFLTKRGLGGPESAENLKFMLDAQERTLRLAASEAIDPNTGVISATKLARFMSNNEEMLSYFPDIRKSLQGALGSEKGLRDVQRVVKGASKAIEQKTVFAKIARVENPVLVVNQALSGPTPAKSFGQLAKFARRGGTDAVEGLKVSVLENATSNATDADGVMSFVKLKASMIDPISPRQPSRLQLLRATETISKRDADNLTSLIEEGLKIEVALRGGPHLEELVKTDSGIFDLVARIVGAKIGSAIASVGGQAGSGHTLIAAGRGASWMRNV